MKKKFLLILFILNFIVSNVYAGSDRMIVYDKSTGKIKIISQDGSANQVMYTDGDGNIGWRSAVLSDTVASLTSLTLATPLGLSSGGTGSSTAQAAIDVLLGVSGATGNGYVATYDSGSGHVIMAAPASAYWSESGTLIYLTNYATRDTNFGGTADLGLVTIDGNSDEIQLVVQGNGTQTANIFEIQNSSGTPLFTVSNTGLVTVSGSGTQSLTLGSGSQSTFDLTVNLSGTDVVQTFGSASLTIGSAAFTAGNITDSALSSGRVVIAGASGILSDDSDMTFATDTLTVTKLGATTLAGTATLAENSSIALDPAGSADGKYTGITVTGTGGATIAFGDLVTLDKDDSRWELVDISVAAAATGDARGLLGMAVTSSTDGTAITVLLHGIIRADANFPTLTIGAPVYASTTGDIVVTQPTTTDHVIRVVGSALTADELFFSPSSDYTTHT